MSEQEFSHYKKDVRHLDMIDVYRVLDLFEVTDQAVGHACKKLLCAGLRGGKDYKQDIEEAFKSLKRKLEMMEEDEKNNNDDRNIEYVSIIYADDKQGSGSSYSRSINHKYHGFCFSNISMDLKSASKWITDNNKWYLI